VCDQALQYMQDGIGVAVLTIGNLEDISANLSRLSAMTTGASAVHMRLYTALLRQFKVWSGRMYAEYPSMSKKDVQAQFLEPACSMFYYFFLFFFIF